MPELGQTEFDIQVDVKKEFTMFFKNVEWKRKIFKVKGTVIKSYLHVLVVLAINAKIADANFHYTECDMSIL